MKRYRRAMENFELLVLHSAGFFFSFFGSKISLQLINARLESIKLAVLFYEALYYILSSFVIG